MFGKKLNWGGFFPLAIVFLIWINSLICLTVQSCCYMSGVAAKGFDLYINHLSSFGSGHRGGYSFVHFNARMISSNHLAWLAILSCEFHPVILPSSSSGGFISHSTELYPVFIQQFQEITWQLVIFAQSFFTWILIYSWESERKFTSSLSCSFNFF